MNSPGCVLTHEIQIALSQLWQYLGGTSEHKSPGSQVVNCNISDLHTCVSVSKHHYL
jgi:hypothetical protein